MNFQKIQAGFRKHRGTRVQVANILWITEKVREFQKNIYFCFIDYAKEFDHIDNHKLWKSLQEMGIPDHLACLLRNLYAGQEATVRTRHGTTDWFQTGKGVRQGCILSPCLFNLYAEYIMRNAGLEEAQAGIKTARRNINNFRYADNTTLMTESEKELKSLLVKVKEESEKVGLKLNIRKTKIMASGPIISWQTDGETVRTVTDFILGGSKITVDGDCSQEIKRRLLHSSKASILWCSAFFIVQLSHPYMTTGKTIALTRQTFVGKVMSLLFNMLSRLVIIFLPRSKRLLISWLQSPSAVILEPPKNKVSHCFPIYLP